MNTNDEIEFAEAVWARIRRAYAEHGGLMTIAADVMGETEPSRPVVVLADSGPMYGPYDVRGATPGDGHCITLLLPLQLDDVHFPLHQMQSMIVQVIAHELEHWWQISRGVAAIVPSPNQHRIAAAELDRARIWLEEYYWNELERSAHGRMIAVDLLQRFGSAARALQNLDAVAETPVWRLISSRILSSIASMPTHRQHNNGPASAFLKRLREAAGDELRAIASGA